MIFLKFEPSAPLSAGTEMSEFLALAFWRHESWVKLAEKLISLEQEAFEGMPSSLREVLRDLLRKGLFWVRDFWARGPKRVLETTKRIFWRDLSLQDFKRARTHYHSFIKGECGHAAFEGQGVERNSLIFEISSWERSVMRSTCMWAQMNETKEWSVEAYDLWPHLFSLTQGVGRGT